MDERIVYDDKYLTVVNKFSGEICSNDVGTEKENSVYLPIKIVNETNVKLNEDNYYQCVNRLDRPVSGLVVIAKDPVTFSKITDQFSNKNNVKKTYIAIVEGVHNINKEYKTLTNYIKFDTKKQKSYIYNEEIRKSKIAILNYLVFGNGDRYSFFDVELVTGRTHQIRAQLANIKFHIKGDVKYGARRGDTLDGIRLHGTALEFIHPIHKKKLSFSSNPHFMDPLWEACMSSYSGYTGV